MRLFYLIIFFFLISFYIKAEANYIVEVHGNIKEVKTHKFTETDNLKFLTINGTFKDNLGNFGQTNSVVYMLTKNNIVEKLEESVKKRVIGTTERPVACLLSGGLDSSLIACLVNKFINIDNS